MAQVYAIRFGKWVEIRESPVPLNKREMEEIVTVEGQKVEWKTVRGTPVPTIITTKTKKKIKDILWEGGTFITVVAYSRWSPSGVRNGLPPVADGECVEIGDKTLANKLKEEYSRDQILGKIVNNFRGLNELAQPRRDDDDYDEDDDY